MMQYMHMQMAPWYALHLMMHGVHIYTRWCPMIRSEHNNALYAHVDASIIRTALHDALRIYTIWYPMIRSALNNALYAHDDTHALARGYWFLIRDVLQMIVNIHKIKFVKLLQQMLFGCVLQSPNRLTKYRNVNNEFNCGFLSFTWIHDKIRVGSIYISVLKVKNCIITLH